MRALLGLLLFGGCAAAQHPAPPPPDDAAITKKSHDVLDAFDRGDMNVVSAVLAPKYVHFDESKPIANLSWSN